MRLEMFNGGRDQYDKALLQIKLKAVYSLILNPQIILDTHTIAGTKDKSGTALLLFALIRTLVEDKKYPKEIRKILKKANKLGEKMSKVAEKSMNLKQSDIEGIMNLLEQKFSSDQNFDLQEDMINEAKDYIASKLTEGQPNASEKLDKDFGVLLDSFINNDTEKLDEAGKSLTDLMNEHNQSQEEITEDENKQEDNNDSDTDIDSRDSEDSEGGEDEHPDDDIE